MPKVCISCIYHLLRNVYDHMKIMHNKVDFCITIQYIFQNLNLRRSREIIGLLNVINDDKHYLAIAS